MAKTRILQEGQSYTFRSYFEMPYEAEEILGELDCQLERSRLVWPKSDESFPRLSELKQRLEDALLLVSLSSEAARREALVFPVLLEVARFCQCQIRIEYPLSVNNWLKGNLDYLLRKQENFLVVEAKNDDLSRGFTQLAVELLALAQVEEKEVVYGAVTIGNAWNFGKLEVKESKIRQDITLYRVPDDLEELMGILVGIVGG